MSQALLAIQNILQNSNIFNKPRETVLFTSLGDKKVTQFSGFLPTSVSHLKCTVFLSVLIFYYETLISIAALNQAFTLLMRAGSHRVIGHTKRI